MKKLLVLVFMLLFMPMTVHAEYGHDLTLRFYDLNLRDAVLRHINEGREEPRDVLYQYDLWELTELNLSNEGISDLSGIENVPNVRVLNISMNPGLTRIELPANFLLEVIDAQHNPNLEYVNLTLNANLTRVDLRGAPLDVEIIPPVQLGQANPDELIFTELATPLYEDNEDDDPAPGPAPAPDLFWVPGVNVDGMRIAESMFNALNLGVELPRADSDIVDIYLRVRLVETAPGADWVVATTLYVPPEQVEPIIQVVEPEEADFIVWLFSWVLALSAIASLVISGILFALGKE